MLLNLFLGQPLDWSPEECAQVLETWQSKRFKAKSLRLPVPYYAALMVAVYNKYLESGNHEEALRWSRLAILEAAGNRTVQNAICEATGAHQPIDIRLVSTWGQITKS